jgi:hypothetical protein
MRPHLLVSGKFVGIFVGIRALQKTDTNMPLRDAAVRNAKPGAQPKKLSDGGGLHVLIQPTGGKLWRLAYRFGGKQKTLALGAYPAVSLGEARGLRDAAKKLLARSVDPSVLRHAGKDSSFRAVAEEVIAKLEREGRAQATLTKKRWLLDFAYPTFGDRHVAEFPCLSHPTNLENSSPTKLPSGPR